MATSPRMDPARDRSTLYIVAKGGLGNQLFQAALGLALAERTGADLTFLTHSFGGDPYRRIFQLEAFPCLGGRIAAMEEAEGVGLLQQERLPDVPVREFLRQAGDLVASRGRLALDGYWQQEDYWAGHEPLIRRRLACAPSPELRTAGERVSAQAVIGIHVRRHDHGHHGLAHSEYYRQAIAAIRAERGDRPVLCFTDEPNFCRFVFRDITNLQVLSGDTRSPLDDFYLLSCCHHFVIANSTFSWWAAWMGERADTIVYAPEPFTIFDPRHKPVPTRWRSVTGAVRAQ